MKRTFLVAAAVLAATSACWAQIDTGDDGAPPMPRDRQAPRMGGPVRPDAGRRAPDRINGEVTKVEGSVLTVKSQRGQPQVVSIPAQTPILKPNRTAGKLEDIKVGTHINVMMAPGPDGAPVIQRVMMVNPIARGVISAITDKMIAVKDPANAVTSYTFTPRTQFNKDRDPAMWSDLKVGDPVTVEYTAKTAIIIRAGLTGNPQDDNPLNRPRMRDRTAPAGGPNVQPGDQTRANRRRPVRTGEGVPPAQ